MKLRLTRWPCFSGHVAVSCPRSWKQLLRLVAESTELIFVLNNVKWRSFHSQRILAAVMKKQEQKPCLHCIQYVQSLLLNFAGSRQQTSRATLKELPIFSEFTVCIFMKGFLEERLQTFCMWRIPRHFYMYFFSIHTWLVCLMPFQMLPVKLAAMDGEDVVEKVEQTGQKWPTLLALLNLPLPWWLCAISKTVKVAGSYCLSFGGLPRDTDN